MSDIQLITTDILNLYFSERIIQDSHKNYLKKYT